MLVTVRCSWAPSFRCELAGSPAALEVVEFVDFYVPVDFPGKTWKPILESCEERSHSLDRFPRRDIHLFRQRPVDPECFFQFLRSLTSPNFWLNALTRFKERWQASPNHINFIVHAAPRPSVHVAWYGRLLKILNEFIHVYEIMAWLSTLGGAYSAMGDYCDRAKLVAKKISAEQLRLAARQGDPTMVSRCWIFLALSAIQHRRFHTSRRILERQWEFANSREGALDPRLKNMVLGVWSRLGYERQLYRTELRSRTGKPAKSSRRIHPA